MTMFDIYKMIIPFVFVRTANGNLNKFEIKQEETITSPLLLYEI